MRMGKVLTNFARSSHSPRSIKFIVFNYIVTIMVLNPLIPSLSKYRLFIHNSYSSDINIASIYYLQKGDPD